MSSLQKILILPLIIVITGVILKLFDVVYFSTAELFGYLIIFSGMSLVYINYGIQKRGALFGGTVLFLSGLLLVLLSNFDFPDPLSIVSPAFMVIAGSGFFMLYMDDPERSPVLIIISGVFIIIGIILTVILGSINITAYFTSLWAVLKSCWPVVIIFIAVVILLGRNK